MARLNKVIELLEASKPAIGTFVNNGNQDDLAFVTDAGYDFVIIENEHQGLDFPTLRLSLQSLLSRKRIAEKGTLQADPTPLVRVTPNSREQKPVVAETDAGRRGVRAGAPGDGVRGGGESGGGGVPLPSKAGRLAAGAQGRAWVASPGYCDAVLGRGGGRVLREV